MSSIRILVVDDFKDWLRQVRLLLQSRPEWQVIAEASDGLEAVQKTQDLTPDIILLDIGLPELNGIEAARRIRQLTPNSKVIFLSQNSNLDIVQAAFDAGAVGTLVRQMLDANYCLPWMRFFVVSNLSATQLQVHCDLNSREFDPLVMTRRFRYTSPCRCGVSLSELAQVSARHYKFRSATIQTNHNLREYPHDGLVDIFQFGEMDGHLRAELPLVD